MESVNLIKNKTKLLLKLEGNNPGGSLKDRAARNMMVSALERDIKKETIEATSGNRNCIGYDCPVVRYRNRINTSRRFHQRTHKPCVPMANGHIDTVRKESWDRETMPTRKWLKVRHMLNQFANDDNWKAITKQPGRKYGMIPRNCNPFRQWDHRNYNGNFYLFEREKPTIQIIGHNPVMDPKFRWEMASRIFT
jgi:cysteine synthase